MRTSFRPDQPLGRIIWEFRDNHRITRQEAAKILGVGVSTIQGLETGADVKTKLPINPRENTLELLANRMHEYAAAQGRPMPGDARALYKRLMVAAGKIPAEASSEEKTPQDARALSAGHRSFPSSYPDVPAELMALEEPPDEEEVAIVRMLGASENGPYALLPGVQFWTEPREARLRRLRFDKDEWNHTQKLLKAKKGQS